MSPSTKDIGAVVIEEEGPSGVSHDRVVGWLVGWLVRLKWRK